MTLDSLVHGGFTYISLFSGIGGFDLGLDRAGGVCLTQVEIDPLASAVLAQHWPNVKRYKDVRDVGKHNLPTPDVLCGGFPCQDVSMAGKREGLAGKRSGLWFEFHRIITELQPRFVIIENVPGLLSSNKGRDFAVVLGGLTGVIPAVPDGGWKNAGIATGHPHLYKVAWRVLDSQFFGVPQRRRRVFIVASLGNGSCAPILFEPAGSTGDIEPRPSTWEGFAPNALSSLASNGIDGRAESRQDTLNAASLHYDPSEIPPVSGTLAASGAGSARAAGQENELDFLIPFRQRGFGDYTEDDIAGSVKSRDYKDATDLIAYNVTFCDSNGTRKDRINDGLYVNETDKSNTLTQGSNDHTFITQPIAIQHALIGRDKGGPEGKGWRDDGKTWTLDARGEADAIVIPAETPPVVYGLNSELNTSENVSGTLMQPSVSGGGHPAMVGVPPIPEHIHNWIKDGDKPDRVDRWVETEDRIRAVQGDEKQSTAQEHVYFKPNAVVNTLEANRPPKLISDYRVRRLTPRETERLQGFPDDWTRIRLSSDTTTYRQTGNGVTVNVALWIGQRIAQELFRAFWAGSLITKGDKRG